MPTRGDQVHKAKRVIEGPADKDGYSLEQVKEAAAEAVVAVLRSELFSQIAAAQIAAIRQELNVIDKLADTRPSLRPIYSEMTNRIRNLIR